MSICAIVPVAQLAAANAALAQWGERNFAVVLFGGAVPAWVTHSSRTWTSTTPNNV